MRKYGAGPLLLNIADHDDVTKVIVSREISIVYFLIDAKSATHQPAIINALAEVERRTGREAHFLHTSGAKQFSRHAGFDADRELLDTDLGLYDAQKNVNTKSPLIKFVWF